MVFLASRVERRIKHVKRQKNMGEKEEVMEDRLTACLLMLGIMFLVGCAGIQVPEGTVHGGSVVIGFIHVEPTEPYVRRHQSDPRVRFFDVIQTQTGEWTRVTFSENPKRFVVRLSPGHYKLVRIQIGEGPFRSEAQVKMSFDVLEENTMFLGVWRLRVDTPKTERMLQWEVFPEVPDWNLLMEMHPELGEKPLAVSLLKPETNHVRLFAVAPSQPRAKYFYRR